MLISPAYAQAAGAPSGGGIFEFFVPLILIFVIFYFLLIRPQQKRQKEHQAKLAAARRGDKVVLGGGILGTVSKVNDDNELTVKIADGVEVKVLKATLMDVVSKTEPAKDTVKKATDNKPEAPANDAADGEEKKSLVGHLFGKKR